MNVFCSYPHLLFIKVEFAIHITKITVFAEAKNLVRRPKFFFKIYTFSFSKINIHQRLSFGSDKVINTVCDCILVFVLTKITPLFFFFFSKLWYLSQPIGLGL